MASLGFRIGHLPEFRLGALGSDVQGLGLRIWGLGSGVKDLGLRARRDPGSPGQCKVRFEIPRILDRSRYCGNPGPKP